MLGSGRVELVRDVRPYQEVKLRLLNGAHSAIAYLGALLGKPFVADVMVDPALARFVERLTREEIASLTPSPPGFDADAYIEALLRRFANWSLQHRTLQIAMDGSQTDSRALAADAARGPGAGFALPISRHRARGLALLPRRPRRSRAEARTRRPAGATSARGRGVLHPGLAALVRAALEIGKVLGCDLRQDTALVDQLTAVLARIAHAGVRAALAD